MNFPASQENRFSLGLGSQNSVDPGPKDAGAALLGVVGESATAATLSLAKGTIKQLNEFTQGMSDAMKDLNLFLGRKKLVERQTLEPGERSELYKIKEELEQISDQLDTGEGLTLGTHGEWGKQMKKLTDRREVLKQRYDDILLKEEKYPLTDEIRKRLSKILELIKSSEIDLTRLGISQAQIDFVKKRFNDEGKPIFLFTLIMFQGFFEFLIEKADVLRVLLIEQSVNAYPYLKAALTEVARKGENAVKKAVNKLQNISNSMEERFRIFRILLLRQENLTEGNLQKLFNKPEVLEDLLNVKNANNTKIFENKLKKHLKNMYINNNKVNELNLKPKLKERIMTLLTAYEASKRPSRSTPIITNEQTGRMEITESSDFQKRVAGKRTVQNRNGNGNGNGNEYNINKAMQKAQQAAEARMSALRRRTK